MLEYIVGVMNYITPTKNFEEDAVMRSLLG